MVRQTIEAVETLDLLTPEQRDLIGAARTGRLRAELEAARPDLQIAEIPELELGDGELAVYRVVTDLDGSLETCLIVASRDPRLQPGTDVAIDGVSGVLYSQGIRQAGAEIQVSSRLVPFDWDAYWAVGAG